MIEILTLYGMGAKKLSQRMNLPLEEAQQIIDDFFKGFPGITKFTKDAQAFVKECGYVCDIFGRKRHLPDATLPEYEFSYITNPNRTSFNPILGISEYKQEVPQDIVDKFTERLSSAKWKKDRDAILDDAAHNNIDIKNNSGFIARAQRQTLNSKIQGSASSMTKLAMIMINNDKRLKELGFKLLVTVHDEVFGECPSVNSEEVGDRLCEVMVDAANVKCSFTSWSVDAYRVRRWYSDECLTKVLSTYKSNLKGGTEEDALLKTQEKFNMIKPHIIESMCRETFKPNECIEI